MELQRQQAQTGNNLQHLQDLLKIQQEETERYRTEVELLQRTLSEQELNSRKEIEELHSYAKLT